MSTWLEVSDTKVVCNDMPVETVRLAICDWLKRHGIDPNDTCVPGWIIRHPLRRQITFLSYERNDEGKIRYDEKAKDAVRVTQRVQLEAPPLPWPRIVAIHQKPMPPYLGEAK